MIIAEEPKRIETSGQMDEVAFSVDNDSLQHLFDVLRNNIYSDKILAVMREYSTNAYDAHVDSGQPDRAIEITLPSALNATFKVRDYGTGLSPDDIRDIYTRYGKSTKRGTNTMVGQLGLGSKSAFAYSNNFSITSFYNGVKTVYEAFIDESKVGKVNKMWEEPTTEENGVEIAIPVKRDDIPTFANKARTFYQYFVPRPKFGGDATIVADLAKRDAAKVIMQGADWKLYSETRDTGIKAVMGNIAYPVDAKIFEGQSDQVYSRMVSQSDMVIRFGIGDIRMTASREALDYNEQTKTAIKDKIKDIAEQIKAHHNKEIMAVTTRWEARSLFAKLYNSSSYWLRDLLDLGQISLQGKVIASRDIDNQIIKALAVQGVTFKTYNSHQFSGNGALRGDEPYGITPTDNLLVVVNRGDFPAKELTARIRGAWKDRDATAGYSQMLLVVTPTASTYGIVRKHEDFVGAKMVDLKTVTPHYPNKANANPTGQPTKQGSRCFVYNNNNKGYHYASSDNWDISTVNPEKDAGVYLNIYAFEPSDAERKWMRNNPTLNHLNRIVAALTDAGITMPAPLYGFKGNVKKIGAKMVPFQQWLLATLKDYIVKNKIENEFSNLAELAPEDQFYTRMIDLLPEILPDTPLSDYMTAIKECQDAQNSAKVQLVKKIEAILLLVDVQIDKPVRVAQDLKTLRAKTEAAYPMLTAMKMHISDHYLRNYYRDFVLYANMIGKYHQAPSATKP